VQGRLDALAVAIYERLEKHAIEPAKGTGPAERNFGGAFGDVPADAAQVVGTVQVAARKRDLEGLRPHLAADFRWSDGAPGSAETALALWGADPSSLGQLAALLEKGCGHQGEVVTCPAGAATGPRAGFRREGDIWRFAFFLRE